MNRVNFLAVLACAAVTFASPNIGRASILGTMLTSNSSNSLDELADSSAGWFARKSGNTYTKLTSGNLAIGDYVQGVIKIDAVNSVDPSTQNTAIFAAYSFKIAAATAGNGGWSAMQLETGGDVLSLINATDLRTNKNENGLSDSDAAVAIMEKSTSSNIAPTDFDELGDFDASWKTVLSAGFSYDGTTEADKLDDYVITARSIGGVAVNLQNLDTLSSLNSTYGNSATIADFEAAFLIQGKEGSMHYQTVAVPGSNIETTANFYITNGTLKTSSSSDHMFTDAGEFYGKFHYAPEPSTIAIWAAIGLGGCGFVARRRVKAKKA